MKHIKHSASSNWGDGHRSSGVWEADHAHFLPDPAMEWEQADKRKALMFFCDGATPKIAWKLAILTWEGEGHFTMRCNGAVRGTRMY